MVPERSTRPLRLRYQVVFGLAASLLLLNQGLIQPPLLNLLTDAPLINISGRQRMLSQRLAKAALAFDRSEPPERARYLDEMADVLATWSLFHDGLRRGNPGLSLSGRNSPEILQAFDELEPSYEAIRAATSRLIARGPAEDRSRRWGEISAILANEPIFLDRMDRIVGLHEREAKGRIDRLITTGWAVTAIVLILMAAVGRSILRPALGLIEARMTELRDARDAFEARVLERTLELERANEDLRQTATERLAAENRYRTLIDQYGQAARANTLGEMASSLAHELNQPLGAIANYAEGCLVALDSPEPDRPAIRRAIERLLAASLRAGEIIRRIRRFVTRTGPIREDFDPNALVHEVVALCDSELDRVNIPLNLDLAPDLPLISGDPVQIQQVLVNLIRNAIDAIEATQTQTPSLSLTTRLDPRGDVSILVADNGEGIKPDQIGKLFETFFSTRAEGMGIGLSLSRRIIEAHQGRIEVESEPGVGTTFLIHLPRATPPNLDERADGLHR